MVELITILLMMLFAILAIHSQLLRLSIIYLAVFSLLGAFLYLLYAAPELAIAEAAIGSGLVTLLYLASLKRNKVYTIAILSEGHNYRLTDAYLGYMKRMRTMREIQEFFTRREFEMQIVYSEKSLEEAINYHAFDLVLTEEKDRICAHSTSQSYVLEELAMMFQIHGTDEGISFVHHQARSDLGGTQ